MRQAIDKDKQAKEDLREVVRDLETKAEPSHR